MYQSVVMGLSGIVVYFLSMECCMLRFTSNLISNIALTLGDNTSLTGVVPPLKNFPTCHILQAVCHNEKSKLIEF